MLNIYMCVRVCVSACMCVYNGYLKPNGLKKINFLVNSSPKRYII